ncbi:hypothetical protein NECAME_07293 [Necator americanus]|uniref:Uncharacterized protein n=1 Tax=Necator americanus TaxID=51031 RepID=W2TR79_NECAM|nr:hypothetical protein NECAME_07293 [Necator americanus]ETN83636.1 hypothetical protein NECAME_07293 [Necator americanus]
MEDYVTSEADASTDIQSKFQRPFVHFLFPYINTRPRTSVTFCSSFPQTVHCADSAARRDVTHQ